MKTTFIILLSMLSRLSFAHEMPEHSRYQILVTDPTTSTVTEESFKSIPTIIHSLNQANYHKENISVSLNLKWDVPYFSAWVKDEAPRKYSMNFWGGIARIPGMNDNAHALTACHEVGHLLGGEPRLTIPSFLWATSEGQSDYYATSVCLKSYFDLLEKMGKLEEPQVDQKLYTRCLTNYDETRDFLICLNIMEGIEGFSHLLHHLDSKKTKLDFNKKSAKVKATILNSYPEPQCRIETLIAGNFCSPEEYPCLGKENARPQCWFVD